MSELKPCPFCGSEAITTTFIDPDDFEYMPIEVNDCDAEVTCENERCINGWYLSPKDWNTRPIEDALHARIAELEHDLTNKEIEYTELWDDALAFQARITELEAYIDQLIEIAGWAITGMTIATSYSPGEMQNLAEKKSDDWYALIKNLKECDKEKEREE